jgi:1-aminocyclopropane-1-carboxylate deaminase
VAEQEGQLGVFFDTIVVCAVTGSTQAGMIAGFAGQDPPRRVIGIDASARLGETRAQVAKIARSTAELIGLGRVSLRRARRPARRGPPGRADTDRQARHDG